jgi:opacity protein-like surface antigen
LNWGINLGYNYATPRQEIFYSSEIIQNPNDNSWVRFSDMQILSLSLQMKYNYLLTQRLQLYAAAEIGYAFIKQSSEWTWDNQLITNRINKLMLASRCGFSYDLTSKIGLVVGFQYNLFISNNSSIFFQPRLDPKKFINSSYTLSSGLYFKF